MWVTLVVAAAPSLFLLTFFWLKDRYEREPLQHILAAFGLGAYSMIASHGMAVTAESFVSQEWLRLGGEPAKFFDAFVLSAAVEELAKWVVLIGAVYNWDEFDEPLDGVVYGVAVALGFATLENFLYVSRLGIDIAWQRAIFAVPAHALFGGTMGYYAGRLKFAADRKTIWADRILCFVVPVVFHGLYDFALHHRMDWKIWVTISLLSLGFWVFVLRRVHRSLEVSPFKPGAAAVAPVVPAAAAPPAAAPPADPT